MESADREPKQRPLSFFEEVITKDAANDCAWIYAYFYNIENCRSRHWQMIDEAKKMCTRRCKTFKERSTMQHAYAAPQTVTENEKSKIDTYDPLIAEVNFILDSFDVFLCITRPYRHNRPLAKQVWEQVKEQTFLVRLRTATDALLAFIERTQAKTRES